MLNDSIIIYFFLFLIQLSHLFHESSPNNSLSHIFYKNSYIFIRGDIIYKELIKKYIHKLKPRDLEEFAKKNNISYTQDELLIVYQFIKYNYQDLLNENIKVFESIKGKISPTLYKNLLNLYIEYKQKYL